MKRLTVRKDSYYDSVFLMLVTRELKEKGKVADAIVAMGTEMNRGLLGDLGFVDPALDGATATDLVIAVDAASEADAEAALAAADALVARKRASAGEGRGLAKVGSLDAAIEALPGANLAIVSVPGEFAAREARKALERGLHVMLFSDNVSLEDEIALKGEAREKGLLVMGPDCGTSIIDGRPLCFANEVRRGGVGIVAASGTGLQEVSCLLDRFGSGISQAIGTGGRDLKNRAVGGATMLMATAALGRDPRTSVIVVISKPPAEEVAAKVIEALKSAGKPSVVHFLGTGKTGQTDANVRYAGSLEECALLAAALDGHPFPGDGLAAPEEIERLAASEASRVGRGQRFLRGLYTGGTLADEALFILDRGLGGIYSNNHPDPTKAPRDPNRSEGHTVVDLGDDFFTRGKPHPMIDPAARNERLEQEGDDAETACVLLDCVLGYGSHPDPAGAIAPAISRAREKAATRGGYLPVVASVTGTPADFQGYAAQVRTLESTGCVVMPSNRAAALLALEIIRKAVRS